MDSHQFTLTVADAARMHGTNEHRVRNWIRSGLLKAKHFGPKGSRGYYLLRPIDVEKFTPPLPSGGKRKDRDTNG